jgi:hypothetical protein
MGAVLNKTTMEYRTSVNTPSYSEDTWLINPDLSAVNGVEKKYWKIEGDPEVVVEMSQAEKDIVDAALAADEQASLEDQIADNIIVPNDNAADSDIRQYVEDNPIWTDSVSGLTGPPDLLQALVNRREIFGDAENPLGSYSGNLVSRASNLEAIHSKGGWHDAQLREAHYIRPKDLLIYYGWINSFNSATNGWDNEKVAQEMATYGIVVLGDGVQDPGHGDYSNTQTVIARIKALNPNTLIFGYVTVNQDQVDFETKAGQWDTLGVHGIFLDEAGYDYGKDRAAFNTRVDFVHGQTTANICFANAWNMDHIIGTADDVSYPNSTWNPTEAESSLDENDWYLLESAPINTTAYSANDGYQAKADWAARATKAITHRNTYKINLAACGIINDDNADGQDLFDFGFVAALMFSLEAWGTSDTSYGSGSASTKKWVRPDVYKLGKVDWLSPSVQADVGDGDVYWRYVEFGRLKVDFSDSAQDSLIEQW